MLNKKLPAYLLLVALITGVLLTFLLTQKWSISSSFSPAASNVDGAHTAQNDNDYKVVRASGLNFVKPLLYVEPYHESEKYASLKALLQNFIDDNSANGTITSASVYFRDFSDASWIACGNDLQFHPGSLAKVPMLFCYLQKAQIHPELLSETLIFSEPTDSRIPTQTFQGKSISAGKPYKVSQLLEYMIAYSDNNATHLLNTKMGVEPYKQVFADLAIPIPSMTDRNYTMTAKEYSKFLLVLFNASYLNKEMSEYACSILNKAEFQEGLLKPLPEGTKTVHKFGEFGNVAMGVHELHESAIVYMEGKPYLLTVMTKGTDKSKLPAILSRISQLVYQHLNPNSIAV